MRTFLFILPILSCGLLVGCDKPEPSSANIHSALQNYTLGARSKVIDAKHIWIDGGQQYRQYLTAEKVACQASPDAPGSVCDFTVSMCFGEANKECQVQTGTMSGRFTKTNKGWRYVPTDPSTALSRPVDIIDQYAYQNATYMGGAAGN